MLRLVLTLAVLLYASLLDWRRREIDDRLWMALLGLGVVFFFYDFYTFRSWLLVKFFIISIITAMVLVAVLYYTGLMGGGDVLVLLGIAAMYPFYPAQVLSVFPLPVLSVFTNAVLLTSIIPLAFFTLNIRKVKDVKSVREFLILFDGYQKKVRDVSKFEAIRGRGGNFSIFLDNRKVELGKREDSDEIVWVSPALPFVLFITLGFILTYMGIDIFTQIALHWPIK